MEAPSAAKRVAFMEPSKSESEPSDSFVRSGSSTSDGKELDSSATSSDKRHRMTTTLSRSPSMTDILRGTPFATILTRFGAIMRGSSGGIGQASEDGDVAYAKSVSVDFLDVFLSHSWSASWLPKYLTLLLHFNSLPAMITTATVCSVLWFWNNSGYALQLTTTQNDEDFCWTVGKNSSSSLQIAGSISFIFVLLTWHYVARLFAATDAHVFVDKICIHQTDMARKERSIKSIGAFLGNSKMLLVAWDPTYFDRLWCTFELAAYFHRNESGRCVIVPNAIGLNVCIQFLSTQLSHMALKVIRKTLNGGERWDMQQQKDSLVVDVFQYLLPALVVMPFMRRYLRQVGTLDQQLGQFSARDAKCFCCSVGHVIPETGHRIPCDREMVYNSIGHWYGEGDQDEGMMRFDAMVHGRLHEEIKRSLGKAHMSYRHALVVGFPVYLRNLQFYNSCSWTVQFPRQMSYLLMRGPMYAFLLVQAADFFQKHAIKRKGKKPTEARPKLFKWRWIPGHLAAAACGSGAFWVYEFIFDHNTIRTSSFPQLLAYFFEIALIACIWSPFHRQRWNLDNKRTTAGLSTTATFCNTMREGQSSDIQMADLRS